MTKATTHTPGPWEVDQEGGRAGVYRVRGASTTHDAANARLIAAAPELLAACKTALDFLRRSGQGNIEQCRTAIAKAEGGE